MKSLSTPTPEQSPPRPQSTNPTLGTSNSERLEALRDTLAGLAESAAGEVALPWSGWLGPESTAGLNETNQPTLTTAADKEEVRARLDAQLSTPPIAGDTYIEEAALTEHEALSAARDRLDEMSEEELHAFAETAGLYQTDTVTGSVTGLDGEGPLSFGLSNKSSRPRVGEDGTFVQDEATTSGSVSLGGGVGVDLRRSSGPKDGDQTSSSIAGDFIAKENGERGGAGRGSLGSTLADGSGATATGSAELTSHGYRASGALDLTGTKSEHVLPSGPDRVRDDIKATTQSTARVLPSGHVLVYVEPIPGSQPPVYRLTTDVQLQLGGSIGGKATAASAEAGLSGAVSGQVGGSISAQFVYTHILTEEEVYRYRTDLDAAVDGGSTSEDAEFGLISAVALLGEQLCDEEGAQILAAHSSEAAAQLEVGESVQTTIAASINASGSGDFDIAEVEASGSRQWTRTFSVEKLTGPDGRPRVAISIGFTQASARQGGGEVGQGLRANLSSAHSESSGDRRVFTLDPEASDYHDTYSRLMGIRSREALAEASCAPETAPYLQEMTLTATEHDALSSGITTEDEELFGMNLGKIPILGRSDEAEMHEAISVARGEGMSYQAGASSTSEQSWLGVEGETETMAVSANDNDLQLTMSEETTSSQSWWQGLWQRLTGTGNESAPATAMQAIIDPQKVLQDALADEQSILTTWDLSAGDVEALAGRAQDPVGWDAAAALHPKAFLRWQGLRRQLIAPIPATDPELAGIDAAGRARIAQGRALIGFVQKAGGSGVDILDNALRRWGEGAITDTGVRADDLGSMQSWPPSLREKQPQHAAVLARGQAIVASGEGFVAGDIGPLLQEVEELIDAIDTASDFTDPRVQLEMSGTLRTLRAGLTSRLMSCGLDLDDVGAARELLHLDALNHVGEHEEELPLFKAQEQRLFASAGSIELRGDQKRINDLGGILTRVGDLHELWMSRVQSLRGWYQTAEARMSARAAAEGAEELAAPERHWLVSESPGAERAPETEPDGARYQAELERLQGMHASADALEIVRRRYADY